MNIGSVATIGTTMTAIVIATTIGGIVRSSADGGFAARDAYFARSDSGTTAEGQARAPGLEDPIGWRRDYSELLLRR